MKYHKNFQRFKPQTLTITKTLLKDWGTSSEETNWLKMNQWLTEAAQLYEIVRPNLAKDASAGYGFYNRPKHKIYLSRPSVTTLLHEFRHSLQNHHKAQGFSGDWNDAEHDARGWSLSLYFKVAPRSFKRLANNGSILFVSPNDLTEG